MAALACRHGLPSSAAVRLHALLDALAAEPNPPTTVRDPRAVNTHLADSLSGLEVEGLRSARAIVDLGAGAGFPGLPLAIALPEARVDLVESARRKCEVIGRLSEAAGAANARAIPARAEEWASAPEGAAAYGAATARALAPLAVLCEYAAPLLEIGGVLVCWKGARDRAEEEAGARAATELGLTPAEVLRVEPFAGARSRHLHVFVKAAVTSARFPRRPGIAVKRPLGG